ncbi:MAG: DNA translocase FtsK 4TM domain-containing protein [Victivallaceae bacterium]|nr:DNA translocase FtsK 4TM domain-containing protein [Victivallaceae bacterium]
MPETTPKSRKGTVRHLFFLALGVLLMLAVFSYRAGDNAVLNGGSEGAVANWIGHGGAWSSCILFHLFGLGTYVLSAVFLLSGIRGVLPDCKRHRGYGGAFVLLALGLSMLFGMNPAAFAGITDTLALGRSAVPNAALSGGAIGQLFSAPEASGAPGILTKFLGPIGNLLTSLLLTIAGTFLLYREDWHDLLKKHFSAIPTAASVAGEVTGTLNSITKQAVNSIQNVAEHAEELLKVGNPPAPEEPIAAASRPAEGPSLPQKTEPQSQTPPPNIAEPPPVSTHNPETPGRAPKAVEGVLESPRRGEEVGTRIVNQGQSAQAAPLEEYTLPPSSMLSSGGEHAGEAPESIEQAKHVLQTVLDNFGVAGTVTDHISGPRVTRYEIVLDDGVNVKKVESLGPTIAMKMKAKSIRILAPIPGRDAAGVEVPNSKSEAVFMRTVMESGVWRENKMEIPIVLGKNVAGAPVLLDLAKAPHLLIAGSTGSGKSVCMNTLIMSLLIRFSPDELRLIMVDPKVVELEDYKTIPHLITPVINDSQKVPIALRWAVNEMEKRYLILARAKVKQLKEYNARTPIPGQRLMDNEDSMILPATLPVLIVIIDELADLMMTEAKAEVEHSIARITAKGRAAGVHIVVATQRPSTNIITGIIKANLPTRIAFRVGQMIDSRVILDQKGAEMLLGKGDMLFLPPGSADLERIQGAMVADPDIKKVVEFISAQRPQEFNETVLAEEEDASAPATNGANGAAQGGNDGYAASDSTMEFADEDPALTPIIDKYIQPGDADLVRRALEIILMEHNASTSSLQRRLKIGYNRAADLIDLFEKRGIVGPQAAGGSKRAVLIFDEFENGGN